MSSAVLDRWEERLHDIFHGRPYDMLDAALTDTVSKFPLDIKVITESTIVLISGSHSFILYTSVPYITSSLLYGIHTNG